MTLENDLHQLIENNHHQAAKATAPHIITLYDVLQKGDEEWNYPTGCNTEESDADIAAKAIDTFSNLLHDPKSAPIVKQVIPHLIQTMTDYLKHTYN